jgi:transposase
MSASSGFDLKSQEIGALPIVNHFLYRLKLKQLLLKHLPDPDGRMKLRPVDALGVLVRNLVVSRMPLYRQGEWVKRVVPGLLDLDAQQLGLVNDDRMGRALDRLFEVDRNALLTDFVVHMVKEFGIELDQFHNDSTTITLHGEYKEADGRRVRGKPTLVATFGHSKDHRPDLKQLLWILTVSADGDVPVHFKVSDGNTEDTTTHIETWDLLRKLVGHPRFLYVADCKLCTRENLRYIDSAKGWFITILPRSRREDALFRDWLQTNTPAWEEVARKHHPRLVDGPPEVLKAIESPIPEADGFRLVWIFSSEKRERDFLARKGCIERAWKELDDLRSKLEGSRCRYRTKKGVARAAEEILDRCGASRWISYDLEAVEKATFRQEKRGRSGKNTRWRKTTKVAYKMTLVVKPENIEYDTRCDGIFPLITNRKKLSIREILDAYKSKQPQIEKRHHLLKSVLAAMPALLKSISRLEALLLVQYIALTVHALIERELRRAMAARGIDQLPLYPERRRCRAPTADRILEIFGGVQRHHLSKEGRSVQWFDPDLDPLQRKLLQLLAIPERSFTDF